MLQSIRSLNDVTDFIRGGMLNDLKLLTTEVEKKVGKSINLSSDFEKLAHLFKKYGLDVSEATLKKVWNCVSLKEKPSQSTLDKLSLFAGFQSWNDFKIALHGDNSADLNYDDNELHKMDN